MSAPDVTLTEKDREFAAALRAVVAEAGEGYVYPRDRGIDAFFSSCRYVQDGEPSCLIARALARTGVTVEHLTTYEGTTARKVIHDLGGFSELVINAANEAQRLQDLEKTWGEALALFEDMITAGKGED
jgi:hypothetical protein